MSMARLTLIVHDDELGGDGTSGRPYHRVLNVYTDDGRQLMRLPDVDGEHEDYDPTASLLLSAVNEAMQRGDA